MEKTELHSLLVRNMKRQRLLLGLTQAELAKRSGSSVGYIGEVELGRKFPSAGKLEGIARGLETRPFRLLMGPEDVTDAMGPEAVFETAEKLKARLEREIDAFVGELDPGNKSHRARKVDGKPLRGR